MNAAVTFSTENTLRSRITMMSQSLGLNTQEDISARYAYAVKMQQEARARAIRKEAEAAAALFKANQSAIQQEQSIAQALAMVKGMLSAINKKQPSNIKRAITSQVFSDMNVLRSTSAGKAQARFDMSTEYSNIGTFWE